MANGVLQMMPEKVTDGVRRRDAVGALKFSTQRLLGLGPKTRLGVSKTRLFEGPNLIRSVWEAIVQKTTVVGGLDSWWELNLTC